jgi:hypothetical protein
VSLLYIAVTWQSLALIRTCSAVSNLTFRFGVNLRKLTVKRPVVPPALPVPQQTFLLVAVLVPLYVESELIRPVLVREAVTASLGADS